MLSPLIRILVVDDSTDNLFLMQAILEAEGYEVDTAEDGIAALEKVQASPPNLILMDVMMPDLNGYELTQQIRQNQDIPFIPILLVTAHEEANAIQCISMGADDFIHKPIEFDTLLARIKALLKH